MLKAASGMTAQAVKERIATPAKTKKYEPSPAHPMWRQARDLPIFSYLWVQQMLTDPTIRLGLAMRAAPLHSAEFAYKEGEKWTPGIKANREDVAAWVLRTLQNIWQNDLHNILTDQIWGWSGGEVLWKLSAANMLEYNGLLPRRPEDMRCMVLDGELCGVQIRNIKGQGPAELEFPRCLFTAYRPEPAEFYSKPALEGAFSPWADKCLNGGALDVRRLFMHKDAYRGLQIGYPDRAYSIPGYVNEVSARDLAREIGEQAKAGAVITHPTGKDDAGNPLWEVKQASTTGGGEHILQYPKDLDVEELRGLEIPDDVLTAEATGSWAGKTVPMQAFYNSLQIWLTCKLRDIKTQILEPGVLLNFGPGNQFEVSTKPLALQAMEQQGEKKAPGESGQQGPSMFMPPQYGGGGQQPRQSVQMSLDPVEAVGRGVLSAEKIVRAARMALDFKENEHPRESDGEFAPKGSGGQNGGMNETVAKLAKQVASGGLSKSQASKQLKSSGLGHLGTELSEAIKSHQEQQPKSSPQASAINATAPSPPTEREQHALGIMQSDGMAAAIKSLSHYVRDDVLENTDWAALAAGEHDDPVEQLRWAVKAAQSESSEKDSEEEHESTRQRRDEEAASKRAADEKNRSTESVVRGWLESDAKQAASENPTNREERRSKAAALQAPTIHDALLKQGWQFEYMSSSGSLYYKKSDQSLRVADHEVPATAERQHNAKHGGFTWADNDNQIILPLNDDELAERLSEYA